MINVNALKLAASTLAVGAVFATGATASNKGSQAASASQAEMAKVASMSAGIARGAIASRKGSLAVTNAEKAVAAMPQDASYRMLLGEAYLSAGRFASAEQAFSDTMALDAGNVRAALKLSLSRSAQGKQAEAVEVLQANRDRLSAADFGLAMTLAGDPGSAIPILDAAARGVDANAKVRQNLAFAHAMSNNWAVARRIAAQDLAPDLVTKRIVEWAALARPETAADQVAGILGVKPAFDPGQPVSLALGEVQPQDQALAAAEVPVTQAEVASSSESVSVPLESAEPVAVAQAAPMPSTQGLATQAIAAQGQSPQSIVFAAYSPVVQPLPASYNRTPVKVAKTVAPSRVAPSRVAAKAVAPLKAVSPKQMIVEVAKANPAPNAPKATESGRFVVQLGAYSSAKRAEQGWGRLSGRIAQLRNYDPKTAKVQVKTASLFRLSVSGFTAREDAGRVCTAIKASGGECFIRSITNDSPLRFASRTVKPKAATKVAAKAPAKTAPKNAANGGTLLASARR
jgi:Flp pilus assembly protein TadD/cell division protein FtsN